MKALTIVLAPVIGLAALGAQAVEWTSLTGTGIAHHGNGDGAPACSSCHGEHFQGEPTRKRRRLRDCQRRSSCLAWPTTPGPEGHNPFMRQVATALRPEERKAVADYLSSLSISLEEAH